MSLATKRNPNESGYYLFLKLDVNPTKLMSRKVSEIERL